MNTKLTGKVWKYGDNVDTDVIIPARYLSTSVPEELAPHCMEDIDLTFAKQVQKGDMMVAGNNFGCGSSREHAPVALLGSGISCVVAASFARIFYRNAINVGLPIFECPEAAEACRKDDILEVDLEKSIIKNVTQQKTWEAKPFPEFLRELIALGGLVPYVKKQLAAKV